MEQINVRAGGGKSRRQRVLQHVAGPSGVLADGNFHLFARMLCPVIPAQVSSDLESLLRRQGHIGLAAESVSTEILAHRFVLFRFSDLNLCITEFFPIVYYNPK